MAAQNRLTQEALEYLRTVGEEPWKFHFFQVMRRLDAMMRELPRTGTSEKAADDAVRLGQHPTLNFAPRSIEGVDLSRSGPPQIDALFFGLFGSSGALPLHMTDFAIDRANKHHDPTLIRFVNLFHHRMMSFFYRAWAVSQPTVHFDRPDDDRYRAQLGSLLGLDNEKNERDRPDDVRLFYSGFFAQPTRHAEGLERILAGHFKAEATLKEFVGEWLELPEELQLKLGHSSLNSGYLGQSTVLGSNVYSCASRFQIRLGPMGRRDYEALIPGGELSEHLRRLVRSYVGVDLSWELVAVLRKEEVPKTMLGGDQRLGWTSWLFNNPLEEDADHLVLDLEALAREDVASAQEPTGQPVRATQGVGVLR